MSKTLKKSITDVFDEARVMLDKNNLHLTDTIKTNNANLQKSISRILSLRPQIDSSAARNLDIIRMTETTVQHIEGMCELHQEVDNSIIRNILSLFGKVSLRVKELGVIYPHLIPTKLPAGVTQEPNKTLAPKQKEWFSKCSELINIFSTLKENFVNISSAVDDNGLKDIFKSYLTSVDHIIVQFMEFSSVAAFGIIVKDFESCAYIVPIKDFTFLMYPFIYLLLEASRVSPK